ncbi:MAG TPA: CRISPR-associated endonuclease Cas1 [Pirellulaceae bacterium]|nr:CRISPR-associated endonuclease Cas1 [Pirellulaceae bacterium]HMO91010.1 CRISPR-associated endonuclease Cas1 [Pirellulaceae bacterium]HMP68125.1 CRISPR-associated endonuclease Cas1 [Pirellulaceae bacterium]
MIQTNDPSLASETESKSQDNFLPARMLNEFVYCPRLFFLEYVEGQFAHSADTIDGAIKHRRVDASPKPLPAASKQQGKQRGTATSGQPNEAVEPLTDVPTLHARSVTLASDRHQILAKLDLVEATGNTATPVDYKRGRPKISEDGMPTAWEPEQVQLCVQAFVLRENGYQCTEGVIYFAESRQRVTIPITPELEAMTLSAIAGAREVITRGHMPPPLEDSPKCPRCSLVGICLPDESRRCMASIASEGASGKQRFLFDVGPQLYRIDLAEDTEQPLRRLVSARDERRPLYVNTPGVVVGKSGEVLQIKEKGKTIREVRMHDTNQVNLMGPIQISTQALQELMQAEIPVGFFSMGNWFYGITHGIGLKNIFTRREQFRLADDSQFCLRLAKALVAGKIRNSRVMLMRNHASPPNSTLRMMKRMERMALACTDLSSLLGVEGTAAASYFAEFQGMLKVGGSADPFESNSDANAEATADQATQAIQASSEENKAGSSWARFDFRTRNRRPPRDPVNALLSLAYSVLAKELTITCAMVGLDPYLGFYHQPRYGRPALALDLMEPFRPLIAESAVLTAINGRMITPQDFVQAGDAVSLSPSGRKQFFLALEARMDSLVTHPLFGYRVSYRRVLEIQTRLLARLLCGEISNYPVFVTR